MKLSHRDLRVDATIARAFWTMLALVTVLSGLAFVVPWPLVGLAALIGLGGVGGLYVARSERVVTEYVGELGSAREGGGLTGWARAEVASEVPLERPIGLPSLRSPHTRRPTGRGPAPTTIPPAPD